MNDNQNQLPWAKIVIGLVLATWLVLHWAGVIAFSLTQLVLGLWPLVFVFIGLSNLRHDARSFTGFMFLVLGVILLMLSAEAVLIRPGSGEPVGLSEPVTLLVLFFLVPAVVVVLIGVGIYHFKGKGEPTYTAFLRPLRLGGDQWPLKDSSLNAVIGSVTLDLRQVQFSPRGVRLDVLALLGQVTVLVPKDVQVVVETRPQPGFVTLFGKTSGPFGRRSLEHLLPEGETRRPKIAMIAAAMIGRVVIRHE